MKEPGRAIKQTTEALFLDLARRGYKGRIVSVQHLQDLQEEIEGHRRRGLFDEMLYQEYLSWFEFKESARSQINDSHRRPEPSKSGHLQMERGIAGIDNSPNLRVVQRNDKNRGRFPEIDLGPGRIQSGGRQIAPKTLGGA
jgi:hypothetical protein